MLILSSVSSFGEKMHTDSDRMKQCDSISPNSYLEYNLNYFYLVPLMLNWLV